MGDKVGGICQGIHKRGSLKRVTLMKTKVNEISSEHASVHITKLTGKAGRCFFLAWRKGAVQATACQ